MKPMGTITKYYPFIDEETKSILNSLIDESSSYYDFVQRLCNMVLDNEVPVNLAYLAAVQAWWCREEATMNPIQEKYRDVLCIRPWGYLHGEAESDQIRYHNDVVETIEKAMKMSLDDWMEIELHLLHAFFHWPLYGDIPSYLEPLEKAKNMIDTNPQLKCFVPLICAFEGAAKVREGYTKDSLVVLQRGKELADRYNDSLFKYMNMLQEGNIMRIFNVHDAIALFEELHDLVQELEVPYLLCEVLNDSAIAFEAAGEFDLAISCHHETIKIWGGSVTASTILSRIYATLGDGQQALEWINRAFEFAGSLEFSTIYLRKAWALALLNRLEEAERSLDTAHMLIIKSGEEVRLGGYYQISGVVNLRKGDYPAAFDSLEKSLEIANRHPRVTNQNRSLLDLARAEILMNNQTKNDTRGVASEKWLSILEKHALDRCLPGIRMQAALLKSELYQNHGQLKDAHATLVDALKITDSLGVVTLRKNISTRIQELEQLMVDEERVP